MQRKTETRQISAFDVTTIQLPALKGSALRFKLGKVLAPALAALRGKSLGDVMKSDLADLQPALMAIFDRLDEKQAEALMLDALLCTSVVTTDNDGKLIKYDLTTAKWIDLAFGGDVDALWSTVKFALEVNLRGLFVAGAGTVQQTPTL